MGLRWRGLRRMKRWGESKGLDEFVGSSAGLGTTDGEVGGRAWDVRSGDDRGKDRCRSESSVCDGFEGGVKGVRDYRERGPVRQQRLDAEMDELAGRLFDAKVGLLKEDGSMGDLLLGFGGLGTDDRLMEGGEEEEL